VPRLRPEHRPSEMLHVTARSTTFTCWSDKFWFDVNAVPSTITSEEGKHHPQAFPQILPTVAAQWSHVGYPANPHDCLASRGWHGIGCCARWNITQIIRDFGSILQFSECRSDTDPPDVPLETRWAAILCRPLELLLMLFAIESHSSLQRPCPNQPMKPTAPMRNKFSVFATDPE